MLVGGGQVMMNHIPELMPYQINIDDYDDIVLGSPIWNSTYVLQEIKFSNYSVWDGY